MNLRGTGVPQIVADAIKRMMRSGDGAITKSRKGTKQEREIAIESGVSRPGMPYYVTETIGRLSNVGALQSSETIRTTLMELEPVLNRLQECDTSKLPDKEARHLDKATGGLDSKLDQIEHVLTSLRAFVTPQNISQLASILESPADKKLFGVFLDSLPST
ncbi:MAG: hypothetical protein EON58_03365 [Alphaproteobacteria bacterium]|nr:MAG: hypothetical protein EON58_03365 [Alphaproteobacteria bacterium]